MGKTLRGKCCQKLLDHVKQSATDAIKTAAKRAIQKTAEATVDLIRSKNSDRVTMSQTHQNRIIQKQS